jgi:hypothetical protein
MKGTVRSATGSNNVLLFMYSLTLLLFQTGPDRANYPSE